MKNGTHKQNTSDISTTLNKHRQMLNDGVRNNLLFEAIKKNISTETDFLDVGSGTGVWAITAAKLGARRVVAIELEECLIPIIHQHARENGVAGKIEIIHAHSDEVELKGKFDLIVSELFGDSIFEMNTINSVLNLRDRFLAPNGLLIPHKMALFAVPVRLSNPIQRLPAGELPISCDFFKSMQLNFSQNCSFSERQQIRFLAEPQKLIEADFRNLGEAFSLNGLCASWSLENLSESNAIVTFYRSYFTDELEMNNFESQSWGSGIYEYMPFDKSRGELKFNLDLELKKKNWSLSLPSHPEVKKQQYSPVFAAGHLSMKQNKS